MNPLIACLCPTYKRPEHLRNSIACFVAQTYPNKILVILDDAGQHAAQACPDEGWRLVSQPERHPNLPAKLNALAALVPEADILVVWEDDDVYLPHHLSAIAEAAGSAGEAAYFAPSRALSNYNAPRGRPREEDATGRFHGSWAYSRRLWDRLEGYELGSRLDFDQHMGGRCRALVNVTHYDQTGVGRRFGPSYIYRWGNSVYHGSQTGEEGYPQLWQRLGELAFEKVERTGPRMDEETHLFYARHGTGKEKPRKASVCLAMLVRDESATIERCLASVRDFIDTWLIIDTGSTDDTAVKAREMLKGIAGEWLTRPWQDFSANRNQLLELARDRAEYSLWLDADESLLVDEGTRWHGLTEKVYGIAVHSGQGAFVQPRLLHHDAGVHFSGPVAETLVRSDRVVTLGNVAIRHHEDGLRWRDPARNDRDILQLGTALLDHPDSRELVLALAECHAARGDLSAATHYYQRRAELAGDAAQTWYALYRAACMLDERGFADPVVIHACFTAYDFRPTKAEPLVRIARRCLQAGRNDVAADIAWTAITTPFEDRDYFFEPAAYDSQRHLLHLRAALALGRHADVVAYAEKLISEQPHTPGFLQEVDELRATALRRGADAPAPEVVRAVAPTPAPSKVIRPILPATPPREKRKLCIGMATYDDYDGVYFSVQAIRMFHPEVAEQIELLVIDNNPTGPCAEGLKNLDGWSPNYRYVPEAELRGTAVRDLIFREANAEYVLVMDCHVFIVPGALRRLIEYFDANPDCPDILQGPMLYDDLQNLSTHFQPVWRAGMYGIWDTDPRGKDPEAPPFEIPMQGLGVFACRRLAWPGFNSRFRGFGGEEGYIHEKFRQAGGKALCLPFLRWLHRFHRPLGVPYAANWFDRVRNYWIGHIELGLDPAPLEAHFNELLGTQAAAEFKARIDAEIRSPLYAFDAVYFCRGRESIPFDQSGARGHFERLGVLNRLIVTEPVPVESANEGDARALARVLTHRAIIERARRQRVQSVLIVENAADLESAMLAAGEAQLNGLHSREWSVFQFAATGSLNDSSPTCATAYHASVYDHVIEQIPELPDLARRWMSDLQGPFDHLKVDRIVERHRKNASTPSDINEHLDTLRKYAGLSSHVTEMGVRDVLSTWSLLAGKPRQAVSYDIYRSPHIAEVQGVADEYGIDFEFIEKNVLDVDIAETDLLFIDTLHTYEQLKSELARHGNKSRKYIILHDTATFADVGENGNRPGLQAAVEEFLGRNSDWRIAERFANNNGLTCLVRTPNAA